MSERPVVVNATIASAISSIIPAITVAIAAFSSWEVTEEQTAALAALTIAVIGLANAFLSKDAASKVFVPSTVAKVVDAAVVEAKAEVREQIAATAPTNQAGVPNPAILPQTPYPYHPIHGPTGGRSEGTEGNQ